MRSKPRRDPRDVWLGQDRERAIAHLQREMTVAGPKDKVRLAREAGRVRYGPDGLATGRATFGIGVSELRIPGIGVF